MELAPALKLPMAGSHSDARCELHPLFQRYAFELDRSLIGEVSAEDRAVLVDEALFVVERIANERLLLGDSPDEAAAFALSEYGSSRQVSAIHIEGHYEANPPSSLLRRFGRANALSFGLFGCATLASLVLLQLKIFIPNGEPIRLLFSPAQARIFVPDPLPFPELTPLFILSAAFAIFAPVVFGWIVGQQVPVRAGAVVYRTQSPIILGTFVVGCTLLPIKDGLLFGVWQVVFWLPVGCLSAHLSSSSARRKRAHLSPGASDTTSRLRLP